MKSTDNIKEIIVIMLLQSIFLGWAKEYKFCSKDKILYSFTSEACPGGVFLKEPLVIDPQCYCHDTDVQLYNYCNVAEEPDPRLKISHAMLGCQKDFLPENQRHPGYNKIRLMLLSEETSTRPGVESCSLSCHPDSTSRSYHVQEFLDGAPGNVDPIGMGLDNMDASNASAASATEAILNIKQNDADDNSDYDGDVGRDDVKIENLNNPFDKDYFNIDPVKHDTDAPEGTGIWRLTRSDNNSQVQLTNPTKNKPAPATFNSELVNPSSNEFPDPEIVRPSSIEFPNPELPPVQPVEPNNPPPQPSGSTKDSDEDTPESPLPDPIPYAIPNPYPSSGSNPSAPYDPQYPVNPNDPSKPGGIVDPNDPMNGKEDPTKPSEPSGPAPVTCDSNDLCEVFPSYPDSGLTAAQKQQIIKNTISSASIRVGGATSTRAMKPVSSVFEALAGAVEVYKKLVPPEIAGSDLIGEIFNQFHHTFEDLDYVSRHAGDPEISPKLIELLARCAKRTTPLQFTYDDNCPAQALKLKYHRKEHDIKPNGMTASKWAATRFSDLKKEDFIIGTIYKVFDTIAVHCYELATNDFKSEFAAGVLYLFKNYEVIFNKWFGNPVGTGVTNYQGVLRHDDLKILSENFDKVDIAAHMLPKHIVRATYYRKAAPLGKVAPQPEGQIGAGTGGSTDGGSGNGGIKGDGNTVTGSMDDGQNWETIQALSSEHFTGPEPILDPFSNEYPDDSSSEKTAPLVPQPDNTGGETNTIDGGTNIVDGSTNTVDGGTNPNVDGATNKNETGGNGRNEDEQYASASSFMSGSFGDMEETSVAGSGEHFVGLNASSGSAQESTVVVSEPFDDSGENKTFTRRRRSPRRQRRSPLFKHGLAAKEGVQKQKVEIPVIPPMTTSTSTTTTTSTITTERHVVDGRVIYTLAPVNGSEAEIANDLITPESLSIYKPEALVEQPESLPIDKPQSFVEQPESLPIDKPQALVEKPENMSVVELPISPETEPDQLEPEPIENLGSGSETNTTTYRPDETPTVPTKIIETEPPLALTSDRNSIPNDPVYQPNVAADDQTIEKSENPVTEEPEERVGVEVEEESNEEEEQYTEKPSAVSSDMLLYQLEEDPVQVGPRIPEHAPAEAHLIWGGRAYCLQKRLPSLPATVENVYPDVKILCQRHGHKCQQPVTRDKHGLEYAMLEGCIKKGWENIFLKFHSQDEPDVLDICCYDGKLCGPSITTDECIAKCKNYCLSVGSDPKASEFYKDGRCICSSSQDVRKTYISMQKVL